MTRRLPAKPVSGGDLRGFVSTAVCASCDGAGSLKDSDVSCPACDGTGRPGERVRALCVNCRGFGSIERIRGQERDAGVILPACRACRGTGLTRYNSRRRLTRVLLAGGGGLASFGTLLGLTTDVTFLALTAVGLMALGVAFALLGLTPFHRADSDKRKDEAEDGTRRGLRPN